MSIWGNNFSSRERKTIILLSAVIVFTTGILVVADRMEPQADTTQADTTANGSHDKSLKLSPFDPNTVDSTTLADMGIDQKKIRNLLNYRRHNGKFHSADDIARLYLWTAEDVEIMRPYIIINIESKIEFPQRPQETRQKTRTYVTDSIKEKTFYPNNKFKEVTVIDANTADSAMLCSIPGIGATIAGIIIKQRTALGGFYGTEQLLECKYFSEELLPWFTVKHNPELHKLPINTASFYQLIRHPYINKEQTKAILQYRQLYGNIDDIETLLHTNIFTAEELDKLRHYLAF